MKFNPVVSLFLCFLFFYTLSVNGQNKRDKPGDIFIDTASPSYLSYYDYWRIKKFGFPPVEDERDSLSDLDIRLDTISKESFLKFRKEYVSKMVMDTSGITHTDTSFTIKFKNFTRVFPSSIVCKCPYATYKGLLDPLNLYVIDFSDEQNEMGFSCLIDTKTGKSFHTPSDFDEGPIDFLVSKKNNFLLTYLNTDYDFGCSEIYLMKINKKRKHYTIGNYVTIRLNKTNITDIAWINDRSFTLSVKEPVMTDDGLRAEGNIYYLMVRLPR